MAFASTVALAQPTPAVELATVTMADTSGVSTAIDISQAATITIQAELTGTAGTTTVKVSNDGTTFYDLPSAALSFTADSVKTVPAVDMGFRFLRLSLAGGDGTSTHVFTLCMPRRR